MKRIVIWLVDSRRVLNEKGEYVKSGETTHSELQLEKDQKKCVVVE